MKELEFAVVIPDAGNTNGYYEIAFGATTADDSDERKLDTAFVEACEALDSLSDGYLVTARYRPSGALRAFSKKLGRGYFVYTDGQSSNVNGTTTTTEAFELGTPNASDNANKYEKQSADMARWILRHYMGDWCEFLNKRMPRSFRLDIAKDANVDYEKINKCVKYSCLNLFPGAKDGIVVAADRARSFNDLLELVSKYNGVQSATACLSRTYVFAKMVDVRPKDALLFIDYCLTNLSFGFSNELDVDLEISKIITNVDIMFAAATKEYRQ